MFVWKYGILVGLLSAGKVTRKGGSPEEKTAYRKIFAQKVTRVYFLKPCAIRNDMKYFKQEI